MNSYEYYREVKDLYQACICNGKPDKKHILEMLQQCENLIIITSSELATFIDDKFSQEVCDILSSKKNVNLKLIFGDKVLAKKDNNGELYNPLLRLISQQFKDKISNGDYELYYNQSDLFNRMSDGYMHRIIIDGGKYMTIEEPHGYKNSPEHYLYLEKEYAIGNDECSDIENYIIVNCLEPIKDAKELNNVSLIPNNNLQHIDDIDNEDDFNYKNTKRINNFLKEFKKRNV